MTRRIWIFLVLLVAISGPFWWLARNFGFLYTTGLMYAPCFAAVATVKLTGGSLGELGLRGSRWRWMFAAWLVPVVAIAVANLGILAVGAATFPDHAHLAERAAKMGIPGAPTALAVAALAALGFTFGIVSMSATALGEEIGWRGLLTPETYRRWGFTGSSVFVGAVWALWHFPLFVGKLSIPGLILFFLVIVAFGFIQTWFRLSSRSIWPCVIVHGTHNAVFSQFWDRLLVAPDDSNWVGEGGYAMVAVYGLVALGCWVLRDRAEARWRELTAS